MNEMSLSKCSKRREGEGERRRRGGKKKGRKKNKRQEDVEGEVERVEENTHPAIARVDPDVESG